MQEVYGVAIDIRDKDGNILLIEEGINKSWKNTGQLSVVMGTRNKINGVLEKSKDTAIRELKEEIGIEINNNQLEKKGEFVMYVEDEVKGKIKIIIEKFSLIIDNNIDLLVDGKEIKSVDWYSKEKIEKNNIEKLRPGTVETLVEDSKVSDNIVLIKNGKYHKNTENGVLNDLKNI